MVAVSSFYMTALLEYINLFKGIADFLAAKALLLPLNASIVPDSYYAQNFAGIITSSPLNYQQGLAPFSTQFFRSHHP